LHLGDVDIGKPRIGLIDQQSNGACLGNDFMQQFKPLRRDFGMVVVAALAASAEAVSGAAIMATFRRTRSAASVGSRSCWLSAHRY
jgi:hypothetical protein